MLTPCKFGVLLIVALPLVTAGPTVWAQEAKPAEVKVAPPEDPAVEAILATKPTTPLDCARAAQILIDLRRPDLARPLLKKVLDAKLDAKQLAALADQLGSAVFVSMTTRTDLDPEGRQLAEAVLAAAQRELTDPQRLAALVGQLQSTSEEARFRAVDGLRRARGAAVGPLLAVLADSSRAGEHPTVRAMLVELGSDAVEPLLGALEASDPKILAPTIGVLADLDVRRAIPYLLAPCTAEPTPPLVREAATAALRKLVGHVPNRDEAAVLLAEQAKNYFEQRVTLKPDVDGRVELWSWDAAAKQPVAQRAAAAEVSRQMAVRFAREAYAVKPADADIRRLYLTTLLEKAAYDNGLPKPLPIAAGSPAAVAAGFDQKALEDVLVYAMETDHTPAATAAVQILGTQGKAEALLCQGAQPSPLVRALRHPDRRLRFVAVQTILALKPSKPFAGSNYVTDALGYFIATRGSRRALVADLMREDAQKTAGLLIRLGYQVDTAVSGQEVVRQVIASPDYEVIFVAASLGERTVQNLLQQLRFDCRSAWVPVAVLERLGQAKLAAHLAQGDRLTMNFVPPHTEEDTRWIVDQLLVQLGPLQVPYEERQAQAVAAIGWLGDLSAQEQSLFGLRRLEELVRLSYRIPALAPQALTVLGNLSTPKSQQMLVDQASQVTEPLASRKAALAAFQESVAKHGVLLTAQQILLQYDRYNQSSTLDSDTQQVLGAILDCIESRSREQSNALSADNKKAPGHRHAPSDPQKQQP